MIDQVRNCMDSYVNTMDSANLFLKIIILWCLMLTGKLPKITHPLKNLNLLPQHMRNSKIKKNLHWIQEGIWEAVTWNQNPNSLDLGNYLLLDWKLWTKDQQIKGHLTIAISTSSSLIKNRKLLLKNNLICSLNIRRTWPRPNLNACSRSRL